MGQIRWCEKMTHCGLWGVKGVVCTQMLKDNLESLFFFSLPVSSLEKQIWAVNSDGISPMLREEWDPAHWQMSLALLEAEERLLVLLKRKYGSFFYYYSGMWKRSQMVLKNGHNKNNLLPWLISFCFPVMCDIIINCSVLQSVSWREGNGAAEIWMVNIKNT